MQLVKHLNTKEMLTAVDTAGTFNGILAQFQARENHGGRREVVKNFNVPAFHFCPACFAPVLRAIESSFRFSQFFIDQVCCC